MSPWKVLLCLWVCAIPTWSFVIHPKGGNRENENMIYYELFTRLNPDEPQILELGDLEALKSSNFDPELPTKFYAHGWTSGPGASYPARDEYLLREDCNFIAIDWSFLAAPLFYPTVILQNVPIVANNTAAFIDSMVKTVGADVRTMHLMGHSAGAHVVGGTGAMITTGRIPRITGLDPAKPFLTLDNTENRLDTTDADFVDIMHTDAGNLTGLELGFFAPLGHIDFYPNGGMDQPGCRPNPYGEAKAECDHNRAMDLFAESINSPVGFRAVQCDSWDNFLIGRCNSNPSEFMGDPVKYGAEGIYYLATNGRPPYAIEG